MPKTSRISTGPLAVAPAAPAPSGNRVEVLDGLRGLFLVLMLNSHLQLHHGFVLQYLHPNAYSYVDGAYGFVFLSGLVGGLVYGRRMLRDGWRRGAGKIWGRALEIYLWAMAVFAALVLVSLLAPGMKQAWRDWLGPINAVDWRLLAAGALMLQQATWADILPPYVIYMLAAPAVLAAGLSGRWKLAMGVSLGLWFVSQFGAAEGLVAAVQGGMRQFRRDLSLPQGFNIAAWQLLFVAGLMFGAMQLKAPERLKAMFQPDRRGLFWASAAVFAVLAAAVGVQHLYKAPPGSLLWTMELYASKARVGPLCLINLLSAGYCLAWLLIAGRRCEVPLLRRAADALSGLLNLGFLRLIGRHSLHTYVWHVALLYIVRGVEFRFGTFSRVGIDVSFLICLALLPLPALWRERWGPALRRRWRRQQLNPAAG